MSNRLSRAKLHRLSDIILETLEQTPGLHIHTGAQDLRWKIFTWIQQILELDEAVDRKVRQKIAKTRPSLPQGSNEWQILYQQYYNEELQGLGKYRR